MWCINPPPAHPKGGEGGFGFPVRSSKKVELRPHLFEDEDSHLEYCTIKDPNQSPLTL